VAELIGRIVAEADERLASLPASVPAMGNLKVAR